ncbi:hypothetical protein LRR81_10570 [Metabacillus sp. GX 13764]|uniref:hypothetical protein n=1 Tax=Metabacillus kandeliae TaxID=2900151 RepID=UPI001E5F7817|nr:hypothetical protein [Metabacillus kandeliae]MCD7034685.1 hypothetical protein [Metabacillus kandeliae]
MSEGKEEKPVSGGGTPSQELPKTAAFQDEFTRGYMASPKEVEPGYYLFKSKTGGYTMLFPKDGVISADLGHEQNGNFFENITYTGKGKLLNEDFNNQVIYSNKSTTKNIDAYKELVSNKVGYKGNFDNLSMDDKEIYLGKQIDESQNLLTFYYFSFIKSKNDNKSIQFIYTSTCNDKENKCKKTNTEFEKNALMLMKSVKFTKE